MVNDAFATNIFGLFCRTKITSVLSSVQGKESWDRLYSITQSYRFEEKEFVGLLSTISTEPKYILNTYCTSGNCYEYNFDNTKRLTMNHSISTTEEGPINNNIYRSVQSFK